MSDIIKGFSSLVASIFEIFKGIFTTAFGTVESALELVVGIFRNLFNVAEGFVGFILGNIFIIGTIAALKKEGLT
ncbi:hypothetical protein TGAM01_v205730 [Trichoderma gamsii]|uniref:Uncharacterized protein n=1 Tax=Trichoderma gamsii TaxID=398673 RepID=A0A2P4ZMB0_9HYPO|nr:hypothetical protein TGAM01_v205730 [Trichoderma gamsii]PON25436.1 hypothetical protein TGAM01_v205730 [Trichoderma gamsii]